MPQVAISTDFLKAFAAVPKDRQKKVRAFVEKFKADPTQASINYEPIHDMADSKVRTVRIDQAYRAIVIHPPQGDVYLMVWVDHHDKAMDWARNKHFEVNARTGSFQVWEGLDGGPLLAKEASGTEPLRHSAPVATVSTATVPSDRLFTGRSDDELLLFGVPEPLLPAVRALRVEADLDGLARYLPQEATDALYMLAAGYSVEGAIDELDRRVVDKAPPVDIENFEAALERPGTQRQFKLIKDDRELAEMLDAPLEQWRIFLHPSQRKLVEMESAGSARVLGGAGTGKTVVAMHRARYLAKKPGFLKPGERILFTTFTRNLAADIARNLDLLCGAERANIEVRHLHGVAYDVLAASGIKPKVITSEVADEIWSTALGSHPNAAFSKAFYQDEWEKVVQAQDVTDEKDYLQARRVGRGTPLSRSQRKDVWKVLSAYRTELDDHGQMEFSDTVREARLLLRKQPGHTAYRALVGDEVQDFRQADLELLRALVPEGPNDVFVVGDAHQRIYGHQASLVRAGINIRGRRSRRLRINYRTTQQIRGWAMAVLSGIEIDDLDEGQDETKGEHSLRVGVPPTVYHFDTSDHEAEAVVAQIHKWQKGGAQPGDICLVARTKPLVENHYRGILKSASIATELVKLDADSADRGKVRLATMHRVKGLEFRYVLIAGVQARTLPYERPKVTFADEAAKEAYLQGERHLLYVAATRARDELVMTGFGEPSSICKPNAK